jgi:hypothetical protein
LTAPLRGVCSKPLLLALTATAVAGYLSGCATERLDSTAPSGVNLTGEWRFDPNLSDDPDKLMEQDKVKPRDPGEEAPHGGRGGRGGGGGMPPMGGSGPNGGGWNLGSAATPNFTGSATHGTYSVGSRESTLSGDWATAGSASTTSPISRPAAASVADSSGIASWTHAAIGTQPLVLASGLEQTPALPTNSAAATSKPAASTSRTTTLHHLLEAPTGLLITQKDSTVTIKIVMPDGTATADEYTAGVDKTIPYGGEDTASCSAGWRGPAFIVSIKAKKAFREDDYALDDEGHLIVTTDMKGKHLGTVELKRVYDRVRGT